jgi:hypothetical protein
MGLIYEWAWIFGIIACLWMFVDWRADRKAREVIQRLCRQCVFNGEETEDDVRY